MSDWILRREEILPKGENPLGNSFYGYRRADFVLPDGRTATYHGVIIPACVHILAVEDDLTTYLVRQKRPNVRRVGQLVVPETLELPGGFSDPELGVEASARNELREEVGLTAGRFAQIGILYPSPGISNEEDYIFLGRDLTPIVGGRSHESTEQDLRVVAGPFGKIYDQVIRNQLPVSAQTLAAFAMGARHL